MSDKQEATAATPNPAKRPLVEAFERAWSQALTAVSNVEDEAQKVAQKIGDVAGWSQDEVKKHFREFTERLANQRKDLERNVDDAVRRTVARLKIPKREELAQLEARLDQIAQRVEKLSR